MTIHQCPKCELRFTWKTEVDDHCWHDHPEFRHDYPAVHHAEAAPAPAPASKAPDPAKREHPNASRLIAWAVPRQRRG